MRLGQLLVPALRASDEGPAGGPESRGSGGTPDRGGMVGSLGGMGEEPAQSFPSTRHTHRLSPLVLAELASFILEFWRPMLSRATCGSGQCSYLLLGVECVPSSRAYPSSPALPQNCAPSLPGLPPTSQREVAWLVLQGPRAGLATMAWGPNPSPPPGSVSKASFKCCHIRSFHLAAFMVKPQS